jgi:GNAT superfamily N-acetyltransferase
MQIRPWETADRDSVIGLIIGIQQGEFGLEITAADQPDLAEVDTWYRSGGGEFWVAVDDDRLVGTIAVVVFAPGRGAVRKMFVAPTHRGGPVANELAETLRSWSLVHGLQSLFLGTTSVMTRAHRFYERLGFKSIPMDELPDDFPLMAVDSVFYRLDLNKSDA